MAPQNGEMSHDAESEVTRTHQRAVWILQAIVPALGQPFAC